jgi:thioredoxin reductase
MEHHNVVIIGGGPAGLATALALHERGVKDVVVLERETEAGGIPRHCGHKGFGLYRNVGWLTGPKLAAQLRQMSAGLDVRTATTVLEFNMRGNMRVHSAAGVVEMSADKIILATGTRETSRAARLIGGNKLSGVMSSSEFQQRVYLHGERPCKQPVIIGGEWVSYSNLMTCRHLQIRAVAVIDVPFSTPHNAPKYFAWGARLFFQTPTIRNSKLLSIHGHKKVEAIEILQGEKTRVIECDSVIVSGQHRSENALFAQSFLEREGHAPKVTEIFRTSRPTVFAVGNVLDGLETAGMCMKRGQELAKLIAP